jgi:hypothetical protein
MITRVGAKNGDPRSFPPRLESEMCPDRPGAALTFHRGDIIVLTLGSEPQTATKALDQLLPAWHGKGLPPSRSATSFLRVDDSAQGPRNSRVTREMSTRISASEAETRPRSRASLLPGIAGLAVCADWLPGAP